MPTKSRLKYEDLQLGERAVEAYKKGTDPIKIAETIPTYLNTREAYNGLTTTDLVSAAVLGGVNGFLMGKKGTGKSQLVEDLILHYFGGELNHGEESFITEAHNDFELEPLFLKVKMENGRYTGKKELIGTHDAVFYVLEEFTRAHGAIQNQFYSFGNGRLKMDLFNEGLGREGYSCALATGNDPREDANTGGRFDVDPALLSRFPLVLDLDNRYFRLTDEDRFWIEHIKTATPGLTLAKKGRNLTDKVIQAHKEIEAKSTDLGLETEAVFAYLGGLRTCPGIVNGSTSQSQDKEDIAWPYVCMSDCERKAQDTRVGKLGDSPLCHLIRAPDTRVLNAARKYTAALEHLTKLKNPKTPINEKDLAFMAFELTGAYQNLLNENVLEGDFENRNNTMMREVCNALREDYKTQEDYICQTLSRARNGEKTEFFITQGKDTFSANAEVGEQFAEQKRKMKEYVDKGGDTSKLPSGWENMKVVSDAEVFTDNREVPLKHITTQRDLLIANKKVLDKHQKQQGGN